MLGGQRLPGQGIHEQGLRVAHQVEREAAQVDAAVGVEDGVLRLRLDPRLIEEHGGSHAAPAHVVHTPALHAVEVHGLVGVLQPGPRRTVDRERLLDQPVDLDDPLLRRHVRDVLDAAHGERAELVGHRPADLVGHFGGAAEGAEAGDDGGGAGDERAAEDEHAAARVPHGAVGSAPRAARSRRSTPRAVSALTSGASAVPVSLAISSGDFCSSLMSHLTLVIL